jgi:hypothetical protein
VSTYFGRPWDAPALRRASQVPVPVGQPCAVCGEHIVGGDRGWIRPCVTMRGRKIRTTVQAVHLECDLLGVMGHQLGVCHCTGYGSDRAAARELLARINAARSLDGRRPL